MASPTIAVIALDMQFDPALNLLAAFAAGLLIGIDRGWRQRESADGMRVAGVRTFALIAGAGGLVALVALYLSPVLAALLLAALLAALVGAFLRPRAQDMRRDATTMVAALLALALGLLAGAGFAALALAGSALVTAILAARSPAHRLVAALSEEEVRAIARFALISVAVLPFLPDARFGPYDAWNPFKLWLVVVLITGFSIAGYIANRVVGQSRGTIATALIGGAYSSTAVTAAFAARLRSGDAGPFATGTALASAVMYARVMLLALVLAPTVLVPLATLLAPATLAGFAAVGWVWRGERAITSSATRLVSRPFELLPALAFLLAVAGAALLVRWAETEFGSAGGAISLFIAGSFDVDAAMIAYATLPRDAVPVDLAAFALAGTVAVNMAFKAAVVFVQAGWRAGRVAGSSLLASLAVLILTLAVRAVGLWQAAG